MNIPVVGWIDATKNEPIIHLPKWLTENCSTWFFVGTQEYVKTAKGQLYKVVQNGDEKEFVPIDEIERN